MRWGVNVIIGKNMAQEAEQLPWNDLSKDFHPSVQIIVAEKGLLVEGAKNYYKKAPSEKEFLVIKGAGHAFDERVNMQSAVYKAAQKWFGHH